jgi:ABC-2 type transport system permease protein
MKKTLTIAWKDVLITFRDRAGLILMIVTPLALTLVMQFAFGRSGSGDMLSNIPVALVNQDSGQLSPFIEEAFLSDDLADLVEPQIFMDAREARSAVDADDFAAAVIIPENFSESILPSAYLEGNYEAAVEPQQAEIEVYVNPTRPISASVIRAILDTILARMNASIVGVQISFTSLIENNLIEPQQLKVIGEAMGTETAESIADSELISIKKETLSSSNASGGFDWMSYMAPSMAILYMMFTMTTAGRSILHERDLGTLPRMLVSPSNAPQILGGKMLGVYLTGLLQMGIFILISHFLFNLNWGDPLGVILLTLTLVAAATGWGIMIAAFAKTPGQASAVGTALSLIFAAIAGNFLPRMNYPLWLQKISYVSPNAWGLEAYYDLISGKPLDAVILPTTALLAMSMVLFTIATITFKRQYQ